MTGDASVSSIDDGAGFREEMERARRVLASKGGKAAFARARSALWARVDFAWQRRRPSRAFILDGAEHQQLVHYYNRTWRNERAAEIPLAIDFLRTHPGPVLEVGNVLANYGERGHLVIDKYERTAGVVNIDVVDFRPVDRFGAIVVISTLEHVGWDEAELDPTKTFRAIRNLQSLLLPSGRMLITCPLSYNPYLDGLIASDSSGAAHERFLVRRGGVWRETDRRTAFGASASGDRGTSGLWVAEFTAATDLA